MYRLPDVLAVQVLEDVEEPVEEQGVVLNQLIIVGELLRGQQPQLGVDGRRLVHSIARHLRLPKTLPFPSRTPATESTQIKTPQLTQE
jgi:hypothetical protein